VLNAQNHLNKHSREKIDLQMGRPWKIIFIELNADQLLQDVGRNILSGTGKKSGL